MQQSVLPTTKDDAVRRLQDEAYGVEPGQDFDVALMEPGDAWGVARCFYAVYGGHYPFDTYYVPEKLIAANRSGDMICVVARSAGGDIIGFGSLFRNFAHNPLLYETGQATVIPDYRATLAVLCIQDYLFDSVASKVDIDCIFGEPVCNHLVMQKIASISGFTETGIELDLMPGETYRQGDASGGRVSTLLTFKVLRDTLRDLYLPSVYEAPLRDMVERMQLMRRVDISSAAIAPGAVTTMEARYFDDSHALRISLGAPGEDFAGRMADEEARAWARGIVVIQVFVDLGEPCSGRAVDGLRDQGFYFAGFLPQWFGTDGLLMQKLSAPPGFDAIQLLTPESHSLLDFIKNDQRLVLA